MIIIILLICVLLIGFIQNRNSNELSFQKIKDYSNELRSKGLYEQAIDSYLQYLKNNTLAIASEIKQFFKIGAVSHLGKKVGCTKNFSQKLNFGGGESNLCNINRKVCTQDHITQVFDFLIT